MILHTVFPKYILYIYIESFSYMMKTKHITYYVRTVYIYIIYICTHASPSESIAILEIAQNRIFVSPPVGWGSLVFSAPCVSVCLVRNMSQPGRPSSQSHNHSKCQNSCQETNQTICIVTFCRWQQKCQNKCQILILFQLVFESEVSLIWRSKSGIGIRKC